MLYADVNVSKDKVSVAVLTSGGTKLTSGDLDITMEGLRLLELTLKHLEDEISMVIEQTGTYSMPLIPYLMEIFKAKTTSKANNGQGHKGIRC